MKQRKVKKKKDPLPKVSGKFKKINTYINDVDPEVEWKEIDSWLRKKIRTLEDAVKLLNEHKQKSIEAKRLSLCAERELNRYKKAFKEQEAILATYARTYWDHQGKKTVTRDMINNYIVMNHGDTWDTLNERLEAIQSIHELTEKLSKQVDDRSADLRKIIDAYQRKPGKPEWFKV
jgi:cob(I)alamin adenosyltransferase